MLKDSLITASIKTEKAKQERDGQIARARGRKIENPRVHKMLLFIYEFKSVRDYSPSIREIGDAVSIGSTSVVMYYLKKLRAEELLDLNDWEARTVRLTKKGKEYVAGLLKVSSPAHRRRAKDMTFIERVEELERAAQAAVKLHDISSQ